jgi:hypothetical protein
MRPKVLVALLLLIVAPRAPDARGDDAPDRSVALSVEHDETLRARLAAELRSQGFEPVEAGATAGLSLHVQLTPTAIRLSIANSGTGRTIQREAPVAEGAPPDSAIVSLWAVEALRASAVAPAPPPKAEAVTAPAPPPPPARLFALHVAPAIAAGAGGLGPAAQVMVGARRALTGPWGAELFLNVPTVPTRLQRDSGSAAVSRGLAAVGTYVSTGSDEARWSAQLGVGAALAVVRVSGDGADGYEGRVDHLAAAGPYTRVGGALKVSRAFRLRADGVAGALFPRAAIYFADQRVAEWGRPWIVAALGAEALF